MRAFGDVCVNIWSVTVGVIIMTYYLFTEETNCHPSRLSALVSVISGDVTAVWCCAVCEPIGTRPCTPDAIVSCCDLGGNFLTTAFRCYTPVPGSKKRQLGYCKEGECVLHVCKRYGKGIRSPRPSSRFCGASRSNPCKAACESSGGGECEDTAALPDGGEALEDGAICVKDRQKGEFRS